MKKIYEKLYCKDNNDNIRVWYMEQFDNKYRTHSGLLDGEKVTSEWTEVEGKNVGRLNETSAEEQAAREIGNKYKKQLKTGYFEKIEDVNKLSYIDPILAKSYEDYKDKVIFEAEEWGSQVKYNGICCLASKKGMFSRKGEKFISVPHIENVLLPFFEQYPDAVLHGELFNDEYRAQLNEITKLCRKTVHITSDDYEKSEQLIRYYIYDGYFPSIGLPVEAPYKNRKKFIDENVVGKYKYIELVPTTIIHSKEELDAEFIKRTERGDEGLILRKMSMEYKPGRSNNLLKVKPQDDDEFTILDIQEGSGNWAGKAKIITLKMDNGKVFDGTFKGTMEEAKECLLEKNKWIGRKVSIKYNGMTGLMTPQYAQFDYKNCLKGDR